MDEKQSVYLVRPALEGAATAGYGADNGIPGFRCIVKDGFFVAIGFESGHWPDAGSEQVVLAGPVYLQTPPAPGEVLDKTRPPKPLPPEILSAISGLRSKRLIVSRKVEDWVEFLNWQGDIVRQKQIAMRYGSVEADESSHCLRFAISAPPEQWQKLTDIKTLSVAVMPLSASRDPQQWVPLENARGVSIGALEMPSKQIKKVLSSNASARQVTVTLDVYPDAETWESCCDEIPPQGFLVSEIYMNQIPIDRQRRALNKLVRGEVANSYLPDFFLDAGKARTPDAPVLGLTAEDLDFLKRCFPGLRLNREQNLAIAKAIAAPEIFTLQGPPGCGKTLVNACIAVLLVVRYGQRVLMSSQSNAAINEFFARLPRRPEIRPVRIGRKEDGSAYSKEEAVLSWLGSVRDACLEVLISEQQLATDLETLAGTCPRFADMASEQKILLDSRTTAEGQLQTTEGELTKLDDAVTKHKHWHSLYSSALGNIEQVETQLDRGSAVTDLGDWIKLIHASRRPAILGPLKAWIKDDALPQIIRVLLADPADGEDLSAAVPSPKSQLVDRVFRRFTRQPETQSPSPETEPNWAVEWINANTLHNRLINLQTNLPRLLEQCLEAERLCASASVSGVNGSAWARTTKALEGSSRACGEAVGRVLEIDGIVTALQPKKDSAAKLAKARAFLQQVLANIQPITDKLQEDLAAVIKMSAKYFRLCLAEIGKRLDQGQTSLNSSRLHQNQITQEMANINEEIRRLAVAWEKAYESLPDAFRTRFGEGIPPVGSDGASMLDAGWRRYREDARALMDHHEAWGAIRERWIHKLERLTEADKKRLWPMYLERANIVGATCSCCGSKHILGCDSFRKFHTVIIDECSKATPPELLMPMMLADKSVLDGDCRQLPPTFKEGRNLERSFGELAEIDPLFEQITRFKHMVDSSLFEQLYRNSPEAIMQALKIQLRSHFQIMETYNQFYDQLLECGIQDPDKECDHHLTIKTHSGEFLTRSNHVIWINSSRDIRGRRVRERQVGNSIANDLEADCAIRLVRMLNDAAGQAGHEPVGLALISLYGAQIRFIRDRLNKLNRDDRAHLRLRLSTVDDMQGSEEQIVILSMVRSKPGRIGDHAKRYQRINVGMSRARRLLIVLGAVDTFADVSVPIPTRDGKIDERKCYANILDTVRKYGGLRNVRDLL
jgi:hypothetical protein